MRDINLKIFIFIICIIPAIILAGIQIPNTEFYPGWQTTGSIQKFTKDDLYGHINGGAELFLEFGFDTLIVQQFVKDSSGLTLEIYQMNGYQSAMGIYLMKCGKENPTSEVAARNTANRYQLTLVKDKYFIQINNFSGIESHIQVMTELANKLLYPIPENPVLQIWNWLPSENRVSGSELIIRGPYGLHSIYTFGEDDILGLAGKNYALVADYETADQGRFTWIKIKYENEDIARNSFINIENNLDPLLSIISTKKDSFIFMDYAKKYGIVKYDHHFLSIKIHLSKSPVK